MMISGTVVFNEQGQLGLVGQKYIWKPETDLSDMTKRKGQLVIGVFALDPVTLDTVHSSFQEGTKGWKAVGRDHELQKYFSVMDCIYGADWHISTCGCDVNEYYMEDERDVYFKLKKIFGGC